GLAVNEAVRRRRRDLALLRAIGFTSRQLSSSIRWQANITVIVALVVGVPLGVVLGRRLWGLFADQVATVQEPSLPVAALALLIIAVLVVTNAVVSGPGRSARRTSAAEELTSV